MLLLDSRAGKLRRTLFVSWGVVAMRQELGPPQIPGLSGLALGLGLRLWPAGLGLEWELGMGSEWGLGLVLELAPVLRPLRQM